MYVGVPGTPARLRPPPSPGFRGPKYLRGAGVKGCTWAPPCMGGGGDQFSSGTQPLRRGQGGPGGAKIFQVLGAFFTSPFHSEHFEYTQKG